MGGRRVEHYRAYCNVKKRVRRDTHSGCKQLGHSSIALLGELDPTRCRRGR